MSQKVVLHFTHALSQIVLRVVDENDVALPFTATISGWYDEGICSYDGETDEGLSWSDCTKGGTIFTTVGAENANERVMLLIPGNLRGAGMDALLKFRYTYQGIGFDSEVCHLNATGTSTPSDPTDDLIEWSPGRTYIYTYHVTHSGNALSVAVNPWYQAGMVFSN